MRNTAYIRQMKPIDLDTGLRLLVCTAVCCVVLYMSISNSQNQVIIVPDIAFMSSTRKKGAPAAKYNKTVQLMYWTNDSMFNDITCKSDWRIASCKYSKIQILNVDHYTKTIEIVILLYNQHKEKKTNGGDVILMSARKLPSGGNAPGHVTDHMNGSYSGRVRVFWTGRTKIFVKLASAKENQCLRFKAMEEYGNSVLALKIPYGIHYMFVNNSVTEFTRCAPHSFVYGYNTLCNFTSLNQGSSWFCGKPSSANLTCDSYSKFLNKPYNLSEILPRRSTDDLIKVRGHCMFVQNIEILLNKSKTLTKGIQKAVGKCSSRPKQDSWTESRPSGYSVNKKWKFNNCFHQLRITVRKMKKCLKGRRIYFFGDSTLRQYLETLARAMKLKIQSSDFHKRAFSKKLNISLNWRKHEMPFHNRELFDQEVRSIAFQINALTNDDSLSGNSLIVIVHYGAHLQAFPPSVFRSRLRSVAQALRRLLDKKPETLILVKGAAPVIEDGYWFDVRVALIFNEVLFQEFADLQNDVIYLDVFSVSVANNNDLLHPSGETLNNQVQQLLGYIC